MKKIRLDKILYILSIISASLGVLAMFAAKIAASKGGEFIFRTETHWFNDSITALLTSIALGIFVLIQLHYNKERIKNN